MEATDPFPNVDNRIVISRRQDVYYLSVSMTGGTTRYDSTCNVHAMKAYWGVEVQLHSFLTSALGGGVWLTSRPGRFTPQKRTLVSTGDWMGPRPGLDVSEKRKRPFVLTGIRTPIWSARSSLVTISSQKIQGGRKPIWRNVWVTSAPPCIIPGKLHPRPVVLKACTYPY
jgi:hypothetical protein